MVGAVPVGLFGEQRNTMFGWCWLTCATAEAKVPGVWAFNQRHTSVNPSYSVTMKQVWVCRKNAE